MFPRLKTAQFRHDAALGLPLKTSESSRSGWRRQQQLCRFRPAR
jgi:hypothetical protein